MFDRLMNVETINVSRNFIKEIKVEKEIKFLKKLICFDNMIDHTKGLKNLIALRILDLNKNKLTKFELV